LWFIAAPTVNILPPAATTVFENGAVPLQGTATNATSVTITAVYDGPVAGQPAPSAPPASAKPPAPSGSPTPSGSPGPTVLESTIPPVTVQVASDGTWSTGTAPLQLTTGRWTITAHVANEAKSASLSRHVSVAYKGVNLVVRIKGSAAWIKVWVDGKLDPTIKSGKTLRDGQVLTFSGQQSIEVRTGSSGSTLFTLNGQSLGALGKRGIPETWLFAPPGAPQKTQRQ
jgi:hypothetical protein